MTAKTWTYAQITKETEAKIAATMQLAATSPDPELQRLYYLSAFGAYSLWSRITSGHQRDGDNERLERMTERPRITNTENNHELA
jgi:hypothetical protein